MKLKRNNLRNALIVGCILTILSFGYIEYFDYPRCVGFENPNFCNNVPRSGFPFTMLVDRFDMSSPHSLAFITDDKKIWGVLGNIIFYSGLFLILNEIFVKVRKND